MIAFTRFGLHGLGNQMFQYAFLRSTARRLKVPFYCPKWLGDKIFMLEDDSERTREKPVLNNLYVEPLAKPGFNLCALKIQDNTDLFGFFESERYWEVDEVMLWYRFRPEVLTAIQMKYRNFDFSNATAIHMRFNDVKATPEKLIPNVNFYRTALHKINSPGKLLIFTDEIPEAQKMVRALGWNVMWIMGNKSYEDLYLLSRCRNFILAASTFAWWGIWLNPLENKTVVMQKEINTYGYPGNGGELFREGWHQVSGGGNPLWDHFWFRLLRRRDFFRLKLFLTRKYDFKGMDRYLEWLRSKKA